ncbi:MAG: hypothetical protein U1F60_01005 [Planctomycetota bacterium]
MIPARVHTSSAVFAAVLCASFATAQSPLTPGNLVAVRVGDGIVALSAAAAPMFLDEFTPAGVLVQSIGLPTTTIGNQFACTQAGNASIESAISQSVDGRYFVVTGYGAVPGTPNVASSASAVVPRVVARIGIDGSVDTSTGLSDAYSGGALTSAATVDGTEYWMVGSHASGLAGTGGVRHAQQGAQSSTSICATLAEPRTVGIAGGVLLVTSASVSSAGLYSIGGQLSSAPFQVALQEQSGSGFLIAAGRGANGYNDESTCDSDYSCRYYCWIDRANCIGYQMRKCPGSGPEQCWSYAIADCGPFGGGITPWTNGTDFVYHASQSQILRGPVGGVATNWVSTSGVNFAGIRAVLTPPSRSVVGSGCVGWIGTPVLVGGLPQIGGLLAFQLANLPFDVGLFALGTRIPPVDLGYMGAPGCSVYTTTDALVALTGTAGTASFSFALPSAPSLIGLSFMTQGAALDPFANALGYTTSNALEMTIGW